jgi:hypothetical protein
MVCTEPKAMEAIGSKTLSGMRSPGRFSRKELPKDLLTIYNAQMSGRPRELKPHTKARPTISDREAQRIKTTTPNVIDSIDQG